MPAHPEIPTLRRDSRARRRALFSLHPPTTPSISIFTAHARLIYAIIPRQHSVLIHQCLEDQFLQARRHKIAGRRRENRVQAHFASASSIDRGSGLWLAGRPIPDVNPLRSLSSPHLKCQSPFPVAPSPHSVHTPPSSLPYPSTNDLMCVPSRSRWLYARLTAVLQVLQSLRRDQRVDGDLRHRVGLQRRRVWNRTGHLHPRPSLLSRNIPAQDVRSSEEVSRYLLSRSVVGAARERRLGGSRGIAPKASW